MMNHTMSLAVAALATLLACDTAGAQIVVITHPAATPPTREQVADIYLGKNQSFTPVDLQDSAPQRLEFYKKATGRDPSQVKATWSRLVFTGKGIAPRELPDADAVKKAVAQDSKAIGYIDKSQLDASVKAALTLE